METAKLLLISAQALLSLIFGTPNIPEDVRNNAINTATTAILYAQNTLQSQNTGTETLPVQVESMVTSVRKVDDFYVIKVSIIDNNVYVKDAEIKMIADNSFYTEDWAFNRKTNAHTYNVDDWYTEFTYKPTTTTHRVTFTYKDITKTLDL